MATEEIEIQENLDSRNNEDLELEELFVRF